MNWKIVRVVLAFVVIGGVAVWVVNLIRPHTYAETPLSFMVEGGLVSLTNPTDEAVPAQLVAQGNRSFRVASTTEVMSGSSERMETDDGRIHLFEFDLPPGDSAFSISGSAEVNFITESEVALQAIVQPMSNEGRRTTLIAAAIAMLGALYYASHTTSHRWIGMLRGQQATEAQPESTESAAERQGAAAKAYGDNRTK